MFARRLIPSAFRLLTSETATVCGPSRALGASFASTDVGSTWNTHTLKYRSVFSGTSPLNNLVDELPAAPSWLQGGIDPAHHKLTPESKAELLVSCVGAHQTGVVRDLMKMIAGHGGTVVKSKSMTLGLKYCLMASVFVGDRNKANLLRLNLNDLTEGMSVSAIWIPDSYHEVMREYTVHPLVITGKHKFGIIHTISEGIATLGVQLGDMHTENIAAAGEKEMSFRWEGNIEIPAEVSVDDVYNTIHSLTEEHNLKVEFK